MMNGLIFDPDYTVEELLWAQPSTVLVRARSRKRRGGVLLKTARGEPEAASLRLWEQERALLATLSPECPAELGTWKKRPVLVLPDLGARPISNHSPLFFAAPKLFCTIALETVRMLSVLHRQGLLHQFLTPENILVNPESGRVFLLGLGHASLFFRKARGAFDLRIREGSLGCIAPEQTGLINRLIDGRTDIYALGCVFYEMLAGEPAAKGSEPEELIAFHLAGQAQALRKLNNKVPAALAAVVEKCLCKEPDERYQTLSGLSADLARCLKGLRQSGRLRAFAVGEQDQSPFLRPPGRLLGRESEKEVLDRALQGVAEGGRRSVFVAGPPGVGKTALVSEMAADAAARKMAMLSGKFDPVVANRPYSAICQALSSWILARQWEGESRARAAGQRLSKAMGGLGRVIVELAPEAAGLLGDPPPLPEFPPREAQGRFLLALSRFFSMLASQEGLVLYLDDLQWADPATLSFLSAAATGAVSGRFLLVGAFRDTEAPGNQMLRTIISGLPRLGENISMLSLSPLGPEQTRLLVEDICGGAAPLGDELGGEVFSRTSGNPFYVRELLNSFITEGCLVYDPDRKRFSFDAAKAGAVSRGPDQRALIKKQLLMLSEACRQTICAAAAAGNSFAPESVAKLLGLPVSRVEENLSQALARQLIRPVSGTNGGNWLSFSHDHVREEAYALLSPERAADMHLALSRQEAPPGMDAAAAAFFAADHINRAKKLIVDDDDRMEAARKNLAAGRLSRKEAAFAPAWHYLSAACSFLPEGAWEEHYQTALAVYTSAAEAAYLAADPEVAARLSKEMADHVHSGLEKARALNVMLLAQVAKNRLPDALETGLAALKALKVRLPSNPGPLHLGYYYVKARHALPRRKWEKLLSLPDTENPEQALVISLLSGIGLVAFGARPRLTALCVLQEAISISKGEMYPHAAAVMAGYGFLLDQAGKHEMAHDAALLAEKLQERWPGHPSEASTLCISNSLIRPWTEHLRACLPGLSRAFRVGVRAGNFEWGTIAAWVRCYFLFYAGVALIEVDREMHRVREQFSAMGQEKEVFYLDMDHFCILSLLGCGEEELYRNRQAYRDPEAEQELLRKNDEIALCVLYGNKMMVSYFFGRYEEAVECGRKLDSFVHGLIGTQALPVCTFFEILSLLSCPEPREERKRLTEKLNMLVRWARRCPENFQHKLDLAEAEMARVFGRPDRARRLYRTAVEGAKKHSFLNDEALALELWAKFHLMRGDTERGKPLLAQARSAYGLWGAAAKVKDMDKKLGMLFLRPAGGSERPPVMSAKPQIAPLADISARLASLKEEIHAARPEDLDLAFLKNLAPLAGASGALIFRVEGKSVKLKARWENGENKKKPIRKPQGPALFLARKALHEGDWLLVPDLAALDLPARLRRARGAAARSVLCGPMGENGHGLILYLENRYLTDAFDPSRVSLVKAAAALFPPENS